MPTRRFANAEVCQRGARRASLAVACRQTWAASKHSSFWAGIGALAFKNVLHAACFVDRFPPRHLDAEQLHIAFKRGFEPQMGVVQACVAAAPKLRALHVDFASSMRRPRHSWLAELACLTSLTLTNAVITGSLPTGSLVHLGLVNCTLDVTRLGTAGPVDSALSLTPFIPLLTPCSRTPLADLGRLRVLHLEACDVFMEGPPALPQLRELCVTHSACIDGDAGRSLAHVLRLAPTQLTALTALSLDDSHAVDILEPLGRLTLLERLDLSHNALAGIDLAPLASLCGLRDLALTCTLVDPADLEPLAVLTGLTALTVRSNGLTFDDDDEFSSVLLLALSLPRCTVWV